MPTPLREINSLEFVLLINEENNDLHVPAWMGISSLLVSTWREGRSLDVPLHDWGKHGCVEDNESPCQPEDRCAMEGDDWGSIRLVWGLLALTTLESLWRLQCPVTFMALSGKVNAEGPVTSPVLYSLLKASLLESSTSEVFLSVHCGSFPQQQVLNTSAYKCEKVLKINLLPTSESSCFLTG